MPWLLLARWVPVLVNRLGCLIALTLACLALYALVDLWHGTRWRQSLKWLLLIGIILGAVYLPALKMILLRQQSGPASYTHDGGVIQTEATIQFLLAGKNPYREDYTQTPMAEWGFSQYRTALYLIPTCRGHFSSVRPSISWGRCWAAIISALSIYC